MLLRCILGQQNDNKLKCNQAPYKQAYDECLKRKEGVVLRWLSEKPIYRRKFWLTKHFWRSISRKWHFAIYAIDRKLWLLKIILWLFLLLFVAKRFYEITIFSFGYCNNIMKNMKYHIHLTISLYFLIQGVPKPKVIF